MSNFHVFKQAVAARFAMMQQHPLYRVAVSKDELWERYLDSFPEGSNPIYRERREHDCTCCKQFIRAVGDVVAIVDGKIITVWDGEVADENYKVVSSSMAALVASHSIAAPFFHYERTAGTDRNFEQKLGQEPVAWSHFHVNINPTFVLKNSEIPKRVGKYRSNFDVSLRGLREITMDSVNTVLELIQQGSLYRGEEHKEAVKKFKALKEKFDKLGYSDKEELFLRALLGKQGSTYEAAIRNTVIGTLLVDISEGLDLEDAVKMFESKVAPTNYKRPTALITQGMIDKAKKKIEELGLLSALDRRYANTQDVSVNDILFSDRSTKKISQSAFDDLGATQSAKPKNLDKIESISIEKFIADVLPNVESMEIMFEGKQRNNLVSLIAPVDPTAGNLFKWDNNFSWSYNGDVADSIKERVKQAGGNVEGDLCCRLAWNYTDDLDFHMREPNGHTIYYMNRRQLSLCGGMLDLDANGADGQRTDPAENIFYADRRKMKQGEYHLLVHNFSARSRGKEIGFEVEIDYLGDVHHFYYDKVIANREYVTVAKFTYSHENGIQITEGLAHGSSSKQIWGLQTNQFHKVKTLMLSPNFWNGQETGNKHYFFMLEGAKSEENARGFFNEFLSGNLNEHRKVFEIVGSKMKATEGAEDQLSGLGFSSTKKDELIVKVKGSFTRTLRVVI